MCFKIQENAWHEKPKTASRKDRAGQKGAEEVAQGSSIWEVATYPQHPHLLGMNGLLIQLCSSKMEHQGNYTGKDNPALTGMALHTSKPVHVN